MSMSQSTCVRSLGWGPQGLILQVVHKHVSEHLQAVPEVGSIREFAYMLWMRTSQSTYCRFLEDVRDSLQVMDEGVG